MSEKGIHDGHRQRLKARFREQGLDGFEPHNVLELVLFYAIPRVDTNEMAHALIERFGDLPGVLDAPVEELMQIKGITEHAALLLKLIPQVARVYLSGQSRTDAALDSPYLLGEYMVDRFVGRTSECVFLLCLDTALKPIRCELLTEGSVSGAGFEIKQVVERALRCMSSRVALAHNHPRGVALPSNEDVIMTRDLRRALEPLKIELVDHIIVAGRAFYSIYEHYPNL